MNREKTLYMLLLFQIVHQITTEPQSATISNRQSRYRSENFNESVTTRLIGQTSTPESAEVSSTIQLQKQLKCYFRFHSRKAAVVNCDSEATACAYIQMKTYGVVSFLQMCVAKCLSSDELNTCTNCDETDPACNNSTVEVTEIVLRKCCCDYDLCNDGKDPDPSRAVISPEPEIEEEKASPGDGSLRCYSKVSHNPESIVTCGKEMKACVYNRYNEDSLISEPYFFKPSQFCWFACESFGCSDTKNGKIMRQCCCNYDLCNDGNELKPPDETLKETESIEQILKIYVGYSDCGDGTMAKFQASVTPYPSLTYLPPSSQTQSNFSALNDLNIWVGVNLSTTNAALLLRQNYSDDDWKRLLQFKYFIEKPISNGNYSLSKVEDDGHWSFLFDPKLIHRSNHMTTLAMTTFSPLTINDTVAILLGYEHYFQSRVEEDSKFLLDPMFIQRATCQLLRGFQSRMEIIIVDKVLFCVQTNFLFDMSENRTIISNINHRNFENSFLTYKVDNVCPAQSTENYNETCNCPHNRAGPLCMFQCNLNMMDFEYNRGCTESCNKSDDSHFRFSAEDYVYYCLLDNNISVFNESALSIKLNINMLTISWQLVNYLSLSPYSYEIEFQSQNGNFSVSSFSNFTHMEGNVYHHYLFSYYVNEHFELVPFTQYLIQLKLRVLYRGTLYYKLASIRRINSTEIWINEATILDNNRIVVRWQLFGFCAASVRRIETSVICGVDEQTFLLNKAFVLDACLPKGDESTFEIPMKHECENTDVILKIRASLTGDEFENWSANYVISRSKKFPILVVVAVICTAILAMVLIGIGLGYFVNRRHKMELRKVFEELKAVSTQTADIDGALQQIDPNRALIEQAKYFPYLHRYEIDFERLTIGHEIGSGCFGSVKFGQLRQLYDNISPLYENVAIKQLKQRHNTAGDLTPLLCELKVMIAIGTHVNIVRLIGAVTKRIPRGELYIVMELCERSLLDALKEMPLRIRATEGHFRRNGYEHFLLHSHLSIHDMTTELMLFTYQTANGMIFISSKNVIHRDLAARNVLIAANNIVKIADCGLARRADKQYTMKSGREVPIASMALETFCNDSYSTQTDVWAFGVLLWEIFSLGKNPLDGHYPAQPEAIHSFLKDGRRLACPEHASAAIYNFMLSCWHEDPAARPTFEECKNFFKEELRNRSPEDLSKLNDVLEVPVVEIDQRTAQLVKSS